MIRGALLIDGPNVQFTSADQFLSKLVGKARAGRFQIRIGTREFESVFSTRTTFKKGQSGFEIAEMTRETLEVDQPLDLTPESFTLYSGMSSEEIEQDPTLKDLSEDYDVVRRSRCFLELTSQDGRKGISFTLDLAYNVVNSIHLPRITRQPRTHLQTN